MEAKTAHFTPVGAAAPPARAQTEWDIATAQAAAREVASRDAIRRRLLGFADGIAISFALLCAISLLGDDRLMLASFLLVPATIIAGKLIGIYDRDETVMRRSPLDEAGALLQLSTTFALMTWLASPYLVNGSLGRDQVLGLWGLLFICSVVGRMCARWYANIVCKPDRCLIVGNPTQAERIARKIGEGRAHAVAVGHFDPHGLDPHQRHRELRDAVGELQVHRIIVIPDHERSEDMMDLVRSTKALGVAVSILPSILEVLGSSVEFDELDGLPLLGVRRFRLSRSSLFIKRAFDIVVSLAVLLVVLPTLAIIAAAIKLTSRGPVFFRQTRVGRDGYHFYMFKFRTMVEGAEEMKPKLAALNETDGFFKITDDPRITRVGKFLRKTSLDELPQFINVLRGEMSIVGPRPLVCDEDVKITGLDRRRLNLTPGITGHWQVLGSSRVPMGEMVKIDYLYVAGWSLWSDVKLVLRTFPHVLARRGR